MRLSMLSFIVMASLPVAAQVVHNSDLTVEGKLAAEGKTATVQQVSSLGATCTLGEVVIRTTDNTFQWCSAANTWTQFSGGSGGSFDPILTFQGLQPNVTVSSGTTDIFSYVLPGGALAAGKCLQITSVFAKTTATNTAYYRLYFGSLYLGLSEGHSSSADWRMHAEVCNDPGSTSAQTATWIWAGRGSTATVGNADTFTGAVDTTSDVNIKVVVSAGTDGDQITPKFLLVRR